MVVGEYAGDYGFPLPNPVSIHPERFRPRFETAWCMQKLQKNEDTWCVALGDLRSQIRYSPKSTSMGSGTDGATHNPDSDDNPYVFDVKRNDDGKLWLNNDWTNADDHWKLDNRIVFRLRYSLRFSSACAEEFCFFSCPCHPPSILPISSIFSESAAYFFVSSDFVSHRIISKSFNASIFLVARRTYGIFSSRARNAAADTASIDSI